MRAHAHEGSGTAAHAVGVRYTADEAQAQEATRDGGEASSVEPEQRHVEQAPDIPGGLLRGTPTKSVGRAGSGAVLLTEDKLRPAARVCVRP